MSDPSSSRPDDALARHPVFAARFEGTQWIEASAGSGKTWTITGLVARAVLDGDIRCGLDQILVTTFTNAAAAELKGRIRERFARLALLLPHGTATNDWPERPPLKVEDAFCDAMYLRIREQGGGDGCRDAAARIALALASIDRLAVSTIHGFCERVIAEFGLSASLPADAQHVASVDAPRRRAVVALLHELAEHAGDPDDAALARAIAGPLPGAGVDALTELLGVPDAIALQDAEPLADAAAAVAAAREWEAAWLAARDAWRDGGRTLLAEVLAQQADGLLTYTVKETAKLGGIADRLDRLFAAPLPWAPATLKAADGCMATIRLLSSSKIAKKRPKKSDAGPLRAPLTDAFEILGERAKQPARIAAFLRAHVHARGATRLDAVKRRERVRDFDDLIRSVAGALSRTDGSGDALAARIRERWPIAFVDEAQDTDPLQWTIFGRVWGATGRLFVVGDPKQSIYAFRNADLDAYLDAREGVPLGNRLSLPQNRRSAPAYVRAVNRVFRDRFADDAPQGRGSFRSPRIAFEAAGSDEQRPPAGGLVAAGGLACAPLRIVAVEPDERLRGSARRSEWLAERAADEIAGLLGPRTGGATRATLTGAHGPRPVEARDIAVLCGTRKEGERIALSLRARGIGAIMLGSDTVLESGEAIDLRRVLAAIDDPEADGLVRAAVATPLLSDDVAALRAIAPGAEGGDRALDRWRTVFRQAGLRWQRGGLLGALRVLFAECRTDARLARFGDGERRLTNLAHLTDLLCGASPPLRSADAARRWLVEHEGDRDDAMAPRLESDRALVRVLTVHGSKGLEFPVVLMPFASNASDNARGPLTWREPAGELGTSPGRSFVFVGADDRASTVKSAKALAAEARRAERIRLAYVALTRASHHCTVWWTPMRSEGKKRGTVASPFAWLLHRAADKESGELPDWAGAQADLARFAADTAGAIVIDVQCLDDVPPAPVSATDSARRAGADPGAPAAVAASDASTAPELRPRGWSARRLRVHRRLSFSTLVAGGPAVPGAEPAGRAASEPVDEIDGLPDADQESMLRDRDASSPDEDETPSRPSGAPTPAGSMRGASAVADRAADDDDPRRMPGGGTAWGHCLHEILEVADLDAPLRPEDCAAALGRHGFAAAGRAERVAAWLDAVLDAPVPVSRHVPGAVDFPIRAAARERPVLRELEFDLRLDASPERLRGVLGEHGRISTAALDPERVEGLLRGYIDAIVQHDGRLWVVDWKSNRLGDDPAAYDDALLGRAMRDNGYELQGLLYCAALERWLRGWPAEGRPRVAGIAYAFLRGVGTGPHGNGWWVQTFDSRRIDRVIDALGCA